MSKVVVGNKKPRGKKEKVVEPVPNQNTETQEIELIVVRLSTGVDIIGQLALGDDEEVTLRHIYAIVFTKSGDDYIAILQPWLPFAQDPAEPTNVNPLHIITSYSPNDAMVNMYERFFNVYTATKLPTQKELAESAPPEQEKPEPIIPRKFLN